jgi:hypothetical protein
MNCAQSAGGSSGSGGGGSSAKTIVSEVSITIDGIATTTVTCSDGTTEVEASARTQASQGNESGQTYNAQNFKHCGHQTGTNYQSFIEPLDAAIDIWVLGISAPNI